MLAWFFWFFASVAKVLWLLGRVYRLLEIIFQGFWAKFLEKRGGQVTCRVESFDGRLTPLLFVELRFFWREFKIHTSRPSLDFARRTYVPWYVPSGTKWYQYPSAR